MATRPALVQPSFVTANPSAAVLDATWYMPSVPRDAHAEYDAERIPRAVFFDIDAPGLSSPSTLPHMLPIPAAFASAASALGVRADQPVIVYSRTGFVAAARAWWMFRVFGKTDVFVLDGGLAAWKRAGLSTESGEQLLVESGDFDATWDASLVRDMSDMLSRVAKPEGVILDARSKGRFDGTAPEPRKGLMGGHMPGSLSLPATEVVAEDGTLKMPDELRIVLKNHGIDERLLTGDVSLTCGSGVTAAVLCLALHELGIRAAVYDGSWSEYGAQHENPVERL